MVWVYYRSKTMSIVRIFILWRPRLISICSCFQEIHTCIISMKKQWIKIQLPSSRLRVMPTQNSCLKLWKVMAKPRFPQGSLLCFLRSESSCWVIIKIFWVYLPIYMVWSRKKKKADLCQYNTIYTFQMILNKMSEIY